MPKVRREAIQPVPIGRVWEFIADMNNWAHDLPGYCAHEMKSERESVWRLRGDVGILSREVDLGVVITEWVEQTRVKFTFKGVYEPVKGKGQVSIAADDPSQTRLAIEMEIEATGLMGPIINALLSKMVPRMGDQFVAALSADIQKTSN